MKKWLGLVTALAGLGLATPASANQDVEALSGDPANWAIQSGDYSGHRYSKLDQINASNVGDLRVAWTFSTGVLRGHEGGPLVIGDIMYLVTPFPNIVMALDLAHEQKILWKYQPKQDPFAAAVMCCDTVDRGVQYAEGKILVHTADTSLIALDAKTGTEIWKVKEDDPKNGASGTGAPLVVKDKVIVGVSGGEFGVRCYITAYDLNSGQRVWRAYSMGPDADMLIDPDKTTSLGKPVGKDSSLNSWNGDQWKIGGGPVWGYMAYDPDLNLVYYGSGNPSTWNPVQRAGPGGKRIDQKWSQTIFARDADTGIAKWVYQMTPFDEWDYDGVNEPILTNLDIDGVKRKALTHFDRNGFGYTLDRVTGELLIAEKFEPDVNWATKIVTDRNDPQYGRPLINKKFSPFETGTDDVTKGICPSSMGAKNQQPAAYSPLTNLFYVPVTHLCMDMEAFKVSYQVGQPYVGATLTMFPAPGANGNTGAFIAWDGAKGKIVWSKPERFAVWSGALTTAGGIVFYGTLEGYLKAVDQRTGKELFKFKTPSGIVGNPMTYMHDGKQYVAVLSGVGGWAGIGLAAGLSDPEDGSGAVGGFASLSNYTGLGGTLTVFALP
ncbi:MAG: methanol/ethanol family PQQ-dependent dehydrogenase [Proteobacteria bacterium]|nr:methanol/ethanol family PQQ-dependent dehydrogenase [Pseudomonadota bacterium]